MKQSFFLPFHKEHSRLQKIHEGVLNKKLSREKVRGIYDDDESLHDIAQDLYKAERDTIGILASWILVHRPDFSNPDEPLIRLDLSDRGKRVFQALNQGWVVNQTDHEINIPETIRFYENMITKGLIRDDFAQVLINNKDACLRDLRAKLTLLRLNGKRHEGFIASMSDDT